MSGDHEPDDEASPSELMTCWRPSFSGGRCPADDDHDEDELYKIGITVLILQLGATGIVSWSCFNKFERISRRR